MNKAILSRVLGIILILPHMAYAAVDDPVELIRTTTDNILAEFTRTPDIKTNPGKVVYLVERRIAPSVDFSRLSRLILGTHWKKATKDQRQRFMVELKQLLVRTYSSSIAGYSGQAIEYTQLPDKGDRGRAIVRTLLHQSNGSLPLTLDYSMWLSADGWRIYDVAIEGVSLAANYRASFKREIRSGGLNGLIRRLSQHNE